MPSALEQGTVISRLSAQGLVYLDLTVGRAATCSFVTLRESQLVFCSLTDTIKRQGGLVPLVRDKDSGTLPSAFSSPTKGLSPASLCDSALFLFKLEMVWFIQELRGMLEKAADKAAWAEWLAVFYGLKTGTEVREFPFLLWRSVIFCAESRAGLV